MEAAFWDLLKAPPDIVKLAKSSLVLGPLSSSLPLLPSCSSISWVPVLCQTLRIGETKANKYFIPTFWFLMGYNTLPRHAFLKLSPPQRQFSGRCLLRQYQWHLHPLALNRVSSVPPPPPSLPAPLPSVPIMDKLHAPLVLPEMFRGCWLPPGRWLVNWLAPSTLSLLPSCHWWLTAPLFSLPYTSFKARLQHLPGRQLLLVYICVG